MIAKRFCLVLLFVATTEFGLAPVFSLDVTVEKLRSNDGKVGVQLFDEQKKSVANAFVNVWDQRSKISFHLLPVGKYAVKVFHDENNNRKIDTNVLGIPSEGYGFSNNVTGFMGEPDFSKQLFALSRDTAITITVVY